MVFAPQIHAQRELTATVYPSQPSDKEASAYKPGMFYFQFWDAPTNNMFRYVSSPKMYNCLRETKFYADCWRWSTSREDMLQRMRDMNLRSWLMSLYEWTDRVVVKFNGMPYWLSSSSSTEVLNDKSWREFQVHPPRDWDQWANAIEAAVELIASWGLHPHYEIWNEPDGEYWKGSDAEFLELYRRTALAIRRIDPLAKIGGPGMHTWWRSVDPRYASVQQPYMGALFGHKPEVLPETYAFVYRLLDSVQNAWAEQSVPMDFISYHHFNHNRYEIVHTAAQLRAKMKALGYCPPGEPCPDGRTYPELYLSEWQTTYGVQEQIFQPSVFLSMIDAMAEAEIDFHSIAALADFSSDPEDEFTHGWGMLSGNHLVKPVYKALQLLDDVIRQGKTVHVQSDDMTGWASLEADTLRVLLSHYSMPPIWYSQYVKVGWNAFESLLYSPDSDLTKQHFESAGHTSLYWGLGDWGSIDLIMRGEMAPFPASDPDMMASLQRSRTQWLRDSLANAGTHILRVQIEGEHDTLRGSMLRIDSTHHNIIHVYDSLRQTGFTHQEAVDSLQSCTFPGGCYGLYWNTEEVVVVNGELSLEIDPNTVCYLQLWGMGMQTGVETTETRPEALQVFPNPATESIRYAAPPAWQDAEMLLYDIHGRILRSGPAVEGRIDAAALRPGMYFLRVVKADGTALSKTVLLLD